MSGGRRFGLPTALGPTEADVERTEYWLVRKRLVAGGVESQVIEKHEQPDTAMRSAFYYNQSETAGEREHYAVEAMVPSESEDE